MLGNPVVPVTFDGVRPELVVEVSYTAWSGGQGAAPRLSRQNSTQTVIGPMIPYLAVETRSPVVFTADYHCKSVGRPIHRRSGWVLMSGTAGFSSIGQRRRVWWLSKHIGPIDVQTIKGAPTSLTVLDRELQNMYEGKFQNASCGRVILMKFTKFLPVLVLGLVLLPVIYLASHPSDFPAIRIKAEFGVTEAQAALGSGDPDHAVHYA